jgi:hypothetical protein
LEDLGEDFADEGDGGFDSLKSDFDDIRGGDDDSSFLN